MSKKQFKSESKKLLDLMINSIYTNKDIFLRELISNASDALDKLYFESLTNKEIKVKKNDLVIKLSLDKEKRTITIEDNGIGMDENELENNLGTIAKSGTLAFKQLNENKNIDVIGQFGVGFYSAFMVSDKIEVQSKKFDSDKAYLWESSGIDGYSIKECEKKDFGTKITLYLKQDNEEENYSDYLTEFKIRELVKKYSDYIRYPILMDITKLKDDKEEKSVETLNSMIPL